MATTWPAKIEPALHTNVTVCVTFIVAGALRCTRSNYHHSSYTHLFFDFTLSVQCIMPYLVHQRKRCLGSPSIQAQGTAVGLHGSGILSIKTHKTKSQVMHRIKSKQLMHKMACLTSIAQHHVQQEQPPKVLTQGDAGIRCAD